MATSSHEFGGKIAKALGLKNARSIEIRLAVGEVATVKALVYAERGELEEVSQILTEYGLTSIPESPLRHAVRGMIDQLDVGMSSAGT